MKPRKVGFWLIPGILVLLAVFIIIPTLAAGPPRAGGAAPPFTLKNLQGSQVLLATEIKRHRVTLPPGKG